jgi:adenosylcobinamide kinase/adenosylcobinamide-phosphate guanylyltransferase
VSGRRVLVLGGARSGKSAHAEALLRDETAVDYIATARRDPADAEWAERIARHRQRRPAHWKTIETIELAAAFVGDGPVAIVDSITGWLTQTMDDAGVWAGLPDADARLAAAIDAMIGAWAATERHVVAVTDEVGSGVVPETTSGRQFRDTLGLLNQRLAASADDVWLTVAGIPQRLR